MPIGNTAGEEVSNLVLIGPFAHRRRRAAARNPPREAASALVGRITAIIEQHEGGRHGTARPRA